MREENEAPFVLQTREYTNLLHAKIHTHTDNKEGTQKFTPAYL